MSLKTMTGLEIIQAMFDGSLAYPPITEIMPLKGIVVEKGRVVFEARADARHLNQVGGVNGGFAAAILDSVTGYTVVSMLERGETCVTIDLHIKMLHAITKDVPLEAEGRLISLSRSLGSSEATIKDHENRLCAHATATCMILR